MGLLFQVVQLLLPAAANVHLSLRARGRHTLATASWPATASWLATATRSVTLRLSVDSAQSLCILVIKIHVACGQSRMGHSTVTKSSIMPCASVRRHMALQMSLAITSNRTSNITLDLLAIYIYIAI